MSQRSPALSSLACGPNSGASQATFCSAVRQVWQDSINAEDILFRKASRLHSSALESGDLHSGLRGNRIDDPWRKKLASISCIRWTCPPNFILNGGWQVAAGGQSKERRVQEQRETVLTEIIYSHPSVIPNSPSISLDVEEGHHDDGHDTPIIPITAIEDDDADSLHRVEPPSSVKESANVEMLDQGVPTSQILPHAAGTLTGLEADIGAAATAAFTVLMKSKEQGSLIDTDLLIKILSEPKMIELLKDAQSFDNETTTVQHELKQENSYMIQPAFDRSPVLNLNNLLSSASRDPVKGGSIQLSTKMQLSSDVLAMMLSEAAIPSVPPPCSVLDTMLLPKKLCENENTLLKQVQTASDLGFNSISKLDPKEFLSSTDMLVPKSVRPLPQKLENLVHGSFLVPKLSASSVANLKRAPIIPLQEDPRSCFSTSAPSQPSLFSSEASLGCSAYKKSLSGETTQPIRDANYYKSLVRQHGMERHELQGQKHNPRQFGNQLNLREPKNLRTHLQRQGHGKLKTSSSKPCIYFNSSKGCRLGSSCPFSHELSNPLRGLSNSHSCKRAKLN